MKIMQESRDPEQPGSRAFADVSTLELYGGHMVTLVLHNGVGFAVPPETAREISAALLIMAGKAELNGATVN